MRWDRRFSRVDFTNSPMKKLKTPPENPYEVAVHEEPKSTDRTTPRKSSLCCKFEQE
jgi:hypothetical protein